MAESRSPSVLRHVDLYRLSDPTIDMDRIGLPELLSDAQAITVIEWADRLPEELSNVRSAVRVKLEHGEKEGERKIAIHGRSP